MGQDQRRSETGSARPGTGTEGQEKIERRWSGCNRRRNEENVGTKTGCREGNEADTDSEEARCEKGGGEEVIGKEERTGSSTYGLTLPLEICRDWSEQIHAGENRTWPR